MLIWQRDFTETGFARRYHEYCWRSINISRQYQKNTFYSQKMQFRPLFPIPIAL